MVNRNTALEKAMVIGPWPCLPFMVQMWWENRNNIALLRLTLGNRIHLKDSLPVTNSTLRATEMCSMPWAWAQSMCNPGGIQKAWGKANVQTEDNDIIRGKCARQDVQAFSKAVRFKYWEPSKCFAAHLTKRRNAPPCYFTHRKSTWCWTPAEICILRCTFSS